jgi:hypothetical protein
MRENIVEMLKFTKYCRNLELIEGYSLIRKKFFYFENTLQITQELLKRAIKAQLMNFIVSHLETSLFCGLSVLSLMTIFLSIALSGTINSFIDHICYQVQ